MTFQESSKLRWSKFEQNHPSEESGAKDFAHELAFLWKKHTKTVLDKMEENQVTEKMMDKLSTFKQSLKDSVVRKKKKDHDCLSPPELLPIADVNLTPSPLMTPQRSTTVLTPMIEEQKQAESTQDMTNQMMQTLQTNILD